MLDEKYQQISKSISSAEPNYFVHFAIRYPVGLNKFSTHPHELMPCVPPDLLLLPTSYLGKFHNEMACFPHEMTKCVVAFVVLQQNIFHKGHI